MGKKVITLLTISCFIFTYVLSQPLHAVVEERRSVAQYKQVFNDFSIPSSYGRITQTYLASRKEYLEREKAQKLDTIHASRNTVVINIQDLHCHPEVQRNIAAILSILDQKYSLKNVYVEGASRPLDTSWLADMKDEKLKLKLLDILVDSGKLTGTEYYSIISNRTDLLIGAENKQLHTENIVRLGKITDIQPEIKEKMGLLKLSIDGLKDRYYDKENKKLDKITKNFNDKKIGAEKYYSIIKKYAQKHEVDLNAFENFNNFITSIELNRKVKYKKMPKELQICIARLKQKLPYNTYSQLVTKTNNFTQIGQLYGYLSKIVKAHNSGIIEDLPNLKKFFSYFELNQSVNPLMLVNEERELIKEIRLRLAENKSPALSEVLFIVYYADCLEEFLEYKASAQNYQFIKDNFEKFSVLWDRYVGDDKFASISPDVDLLDEYYMVNLKRNECLLSNCNIISEVPPVIGQSSSDEIDLDTSKQTISDMLSNSEIIVLVTGGFHTHGITNILKKREIPYIVITPNITQDTSFAELEYKNRLKKQSEILSESLDLVKITEQIRSGEPIENIEATESIIKVLLPNLSTEEISRLSAQFQAQREKIGADIRIEREGESIYRINVTTLGDESISEEFLYNAADENFTLPDEEMLPSEPETGGGKISIVNRFWLGLVFGAVAGSAAFALFRLAFFGNLYLGLIPGFIIMILVMRRYWGMMKLVSVDKSKKYELISMITKGIDDGYIKIKEEDWFYVHATIDHVVNGGKIRLNASRIYHLNPEQQEWVIVHALRHRRFQQHSKFTRFISEYLHPIEEAWVSIPDLLPVKVQLAMLNRGETKSKRIYIAVKNSLYNGLTSLILDDDKRNIRRFIISPFMDTFVLVIFYFVASVPFIFLNSVPDWLSITVQLSSVGLAFSVWHIAVKLISLIVVSKGKVIVENGEITLNPLKEIVRNDLPRILSRIPVGAFLSIPLFPVAKAVIFPFLTSIGIPIEGLYSYGLLGVFAKNLLYNFVILSGFHIALHLIMKLFVLIGKFIQKIKPWGDSLSEAREAAEIAAKFGDGRRKYMADYIFAMLRAQLALDELFASDDPLILEEAVGLTKSKTGIVTYENIVKWKDNLIKLEEYGLLTDLLEHALKNGMKIPVSDINDVITQMQQNDYAEFACSLAVTAMNAGLNIFETTGVNEFVNELSDDDFYAEVPVIVLAIKKQFIKPAKKDITGWMDKCLTPDSFEGIDYDGYFQLAELVVSKAVYSAKGDFVKIDEYGEFSEDDIFHCISSLESASTGGDEFNLDAFVKARKLEIMLINKGFKGVSVDDIKASVEKCFAEAEKAIGSERREKLDLAISLVSFAVKNIGNLLERADLDKWDFRVIETDLTPDSSKIPVAAIESEHNEGIVVTAEVADKWVRNTIRLSRDKKIEIYEDNAVQYAEASIERIEGISGEIVKGWVEAFSEVGLEKKAVQVINTALKHNKFSNRQIETIIEKYSSRFLYEEAAKIFEEAVNNGYTFDGRVVYEWINKIVEAKGIQIAYRMIVGAMRVGIKLPGQVEDGDMNTIVSNWLEQVKKKNTTKYVVQFALAARMAGYEVASDEEITGWQIDSLENEDPRQIIRNAIFLMDVYRRYPLAGEESRTFDEIGRIFIDLATDGQDFTLGTPITSMFTTIQEQVGRIPAFAGLSLMLESFLDMLPWVDIRLTAIAGRLTERLFGENLFKNVKAFQSILVQLFTGQHRNENWIMENLQGDYLLAQQKLEQGFKAQGLDDINVRLSESPDVFRGDAQAREIFGIPALLVYEQIDETGMTKPVFYVHKEYCLELLAEDNKHTDRNLFNEFAKEEAEEADRIGRLILDGTGALEAYRQSQSHNDLFLDIAKRVGQKILSEQEANLPQEIIDLRNRARQQRAESSIKAITESIKAAVKVTATPKEMARSAVLNQPDQLVTQYGMDKHTVEIHGTMDTDMESLKGTLIERAKLGLNEIGFTFSKAEDMQTDEFEELTPQVPYLLAKRGNKHVKLKIWIQKVSADGANAVIIHIQDPSDSDLAQDRRIKLSDDPNDRIRRIVQGKLMHQAIYRIYTNRENFSNYVVEGLPIENLSDNLIRPNVLYINDPLVDPGMIPEEMKKGYIEVTDGGISYNIRFFDLEESEQMYQDNNTTVAAVLDGLSRGDLDALNLSRNVDVMISQEDLKDPQKGLVKVGPEYKTKSNEAGAIQGVDIMAGLNISDEMKNSSIQNMPQHLNIKLKHMRAGMPKAKATVVMMNGLYSEEDPNAFNPSLGTQEQVTEALGGMMQDEVQIVPRFVIKDKSQIRGLADTVAQKIVSGVNGVSYYGACLDFTDMEDADEAAFRAMIRALEAASIDNDFIIWIALPEALESYRPNIKEASNLRELRKWVYSAEYVPENLEHGMYVEILPSAVTEVLPDEIFGKFSGVNGFVVPIGFMGGTADDRRNIFRKLLNLDGAENDNEVAYNKGYRVFSDRETPLEITEQLGSLKQTVEDYFAQEVKSEQMQVITTAINSSEFIEDEELARLKARIERYIERLHAMQDDQRAMHYQELMYYLQGVFDKIADRMNEEAIKEIMNNSMTAAGIGANIAITYSG